MPSEIEKTESTQRYYDQLASEYHLIFNDWRKSVRWHGEVLENLIRKEVVNTPISILDCTCGIGTQAIGLALRGFSITGSDISSEAINRAKQEASSFNVSIQFTVADVLTVDRQISGCYDVVISCDNSLPHLLTKDELRVAINNIQSKIKPNGIFLASIRNYDEILKEKPKSTIPQVYNDDNGRRIVFQIWNWVDNEDRYLFELFILREIHGGWKVSKYSSQYRALRRQELTDVLLAVGFSDIHWLMPNESGYYQPIVISRK